MTQQPEWETLYASDTEAVYVDKTGVYRPEMLRISEPLENGKCLKWRFAMDRCYYENGILSDNQFHTDMPAWFADELVSVASVVGMTEAELIECLTSEDVSKLARGYDALCAYYGEGEFDHYEKWVTEEEATELLSA